MDKNVEQIMLTAQESMGSYYLSALCKAADKLTESFGFMDITSLFNDLIFYINNPECAKEADKYTLMGVSENVLHIISLMSSIYESQRNLYEHMRDKQILLP